MVGVLEGEPERSARAGHACSSCIHTVTVIRLNYVTGQLCH